ncbi:MAG: hypothetical protein IKE43_04240 [Coriobacteriales bacterium]|nr:hypothetical protein [Coriobacteriales bacterium]
MRTCTRRAFILQAGSTLGLLAIGACGVRTSRLIMQKAHAEESTAAALASAQEQYEAVQAQIDAYAWQTEQTSIELADTLDQIENARLLLDQSRELMMQTQEELNQSQNELAQVMIQNYKSGSLQPVEILLSSRSWDELIQNVYYLTKINDADVQLIEHTREVKRTYDMQVSAYESWLSELEYYQSLQESQLAELSEQQNATYALLSSLGEEVAALTDQYNAELFAQAQAAAASQAGYSESYSEDGSYQDYGVSYSGGSAQSVINACSYTPSPGQGWCAAWVTNVFVNAGIGYIGGNACDMYGWCYSSDIGSLQPGMIVAVSTHNLSSAGRIYGHVGIYVGGGIVMDNVGYINSSDIYSWISTYSTTVPVRWGWLGGIVLG